MIEILSKGDLRKIKSVKIKEYLEYSFNRLPSDYEYPDFGYFVVIEELDELIPDSINLSSYSFSGLNNGLYDEINMVEVKNETMEILIFIGNDISISLVLLTSILDTSHRDKLLSYQI